MKTMIIVAIPVDGGGYTLQGINPDGDIECPQEGRVHKSRQSAYRDCTAMYNNSTWQGRKVRRGYRIVVD